MEGVLFRHRRCPAHHRWPHLSIWSQCVASISLKINDNWWNLGLISFHFHSQKLVVEIHWDGTESQTGEGRNIPDSMQNGNLAFQKMKTTLLCSHHHFQLLTGDVTHYCSLQYQKRKAHHVKNILRVTYQEAPSSLQRHTQNTQNPTRSATSDSWMHIIYIWRFRTMWVPLNHPFQ